MKNIIIAAVMAIISTSAFAGEVKNLNEYTCEELKAVFGELVTEETCEYLTDSAS